MLEPNLVALRNRFPVVLDRILALGQQPPIHFKYIGDELHTLRSGKSFPTYGTGKQDKLFWNWLSAIPLKNESLYSVTGFGNGAQIRYLLQNTKGGTYLLVSEKDPALLRETFSHFDCSDFLMNDRFLLGTGECDELFFKDLQAAAMLSLSEVNSLVFSPLHCVDESYYDQARNEMIRQYLVVRPLMEVNLRTGVNLQQNSLENIHHMATSPDIGELAGQFEDIPFILVGAGPSLDDSIDFLKKVQNKAIIVTSNSPYRKLINSGIKPHLVVTADPLSPTLAGFQNVKLEGVPLACPFSAYPEIVKRFSGRIISWVTFSPMIDVIKDFMGEKPGTPIMEQGTVSGCVLDISRVLGSKKVLFIGQDMCVRSDGKYYTDDSSYSDSGSHYTNKQEGHRLPGNTIDEVIVEGRLFVYLKTFEQFIAENKSVEYRNLAATGVKVRGADYITQEDALDWVGLTTSSFSFGEKISELFNDQKDMPELTEIFSGLRTFLENLLKHCLTLAIKTEMLPEKYSGTNYSENKTILGLLKDSNKVNDLVDSNSKYWHILLDGKTKAELAVYKRVVRDIDSPNKNWALVHKNKEYFWALTEGCHWLLDLLNQKIFNNSTDSQ
jgi:hypothetical protein